MRANVGGRHAGEIKKSKIKFARMAASYSNLWLNGKCD